MTFICFKNVEKSKNIFKNNEEPFKYFGDFLNYFLTYILSKYKSKYKSK
jgi:hypothetical protein